MEKRKLATKAPENTVYSQEELEELRVIHLKAFDTVGFLSYRSDSVGWRALYGDAGEHRATILIRAMEDAAREEERTGETKETEELTVWIANNLLRYVTENDAEFFETLAKCLRLKREGKSYRELSKTDLHLTPKIGRPKSTYDIGRVFAMVVFEVTRKRIANYCYEDEITGEAISRSELINETFAKQRQYGLENPSPMNNGYLSKLLTEYGFNKFVR